MLDKQSIFDFCETNLSHCENAAAWLGDVICQFSYTSISASEGRGKCGLKEEFLLFFP